MTIERLKAAHEAQPFRPFVIHLADGRAIVDLKRTDLPDHVCDLSAALDACEGMSVNIEIKNWPDDVDFDAGEAVAQYVVGEVDRRGSHGDVLVSCFHRPTIDCIHAEDPGIPTAFLHHVVSGTWEELAADVAAGGHAFLHPWDGIVDDRYMAAAQANGLEVNVWTVDDPTRMAGLIELGVHGLCTNVPDVARKVLDHH